MIVVEQRRPVHNVMLTLAVLLAFGVAVAYVLIGTNMLSVGSLTPAEKPAAIIYAAAGSYVVGGLLIMLRRRALWVVGAVINALVMLAFFMAYQERLDVVVSPGGLITKITQLLLEANLLYLLITKQHQMHHKAR